MRLARATRRLTIFRRCSHSACSLRVSSESGTQGRSLSECLLRKSSSSSASVGYPWRRWFETLHGNEPELWD